jgi:hypothetical protein
VELVEVEEESSEQELLELQILVELDKEPLELVEQLAHQVLVVVVVAQLQLQARLQEHLEQVVLEAEAEEQQSVLEQLQQLEALEALVAFCFTTKI